MKWWYQIDSTYQVDSNYFAGHIHIVVLPYSSGQSNNRSTRSVQIAIQHTTKYPSLHYEEISQQQTSNLFQMHTAQYPSFLFFFTGKKKEKKRKEKTGQLDKFFVHCIPNSIPHHISKRFNLCAYQDHNQAPQSTLKHYKQNKTYRSMEENKSTYQLKWPTWKWQPKSTYWNTICSSRWKSRERKRSNQ